MDSLNWSAVMWVSNLSFLNSSCHSLLDEHNLLYCVLTLDKIKSLTQVSPLGLLPFSVIQNKTHRKLNPCNANPNWN